MNILQLKCNLNLAMKTTQRIYYFVAKLAIRVVLQCCSGPLMLRTAKFTL